MCRENDVAILPFEYRWRFQFISFSKHIFREPELVEITHYKWENDKSYFAVEFVGRSILSFR